MMSSRSPAATPGSRTIINLPKEHRGERLDHALATALPGQSRAALQRLLRGGQVRVGGSAARPSYRVRGGERVLIEWPPAERSALDPEAGPLEVLYQDDDLLVVNKAPGMTVHPGAGARRGTLVHVLLHHCRDLSGIGGTERPGIVHRLDRDTSGVLVVAKNDQTHRALASQFKARTVNKLYEALVWGRPRSRSGKIDAPIGRHPKARVKMAVRREGRPARSSYRVVAYLGPVSLLEIQPETGRTHQLRVHMTAMGHPILGDKVYGRHRAGTIRDREARLAIQSYDGLALHARRLGFRHPRSGDWREFEAPRPGALERLLEALRASPS